MKSGRLALLAVSLLTAGGIHRIGRPGNGQRAGSPGARRRRGAVFTAADRG